MVLKAFPNKVPNFGNFVRIKIKETDSLNSLKKEIRKWVPEIRRWRFCKQYKSGVGFLPYLILFVIFRMFALSFYYYILTIFLFLL